MAFPRCVGCFPHLHESQGGERLAMSHNLGYDLTTASSRVTRQLKLCRLASDGKTSTEQFIFSNMGSPGSLPHKVYRDNTTRVVSI